MKCPKCGKDDHIHRSRRSGSWQRFVSIFLMYRPYRCHRCNTRFWRPRFLAYKNARTLPAKRGKRGKRRKRSRSHSSPEDAPRGGS